PEEPGWKLYLCRRRQQPSTTLRTTPRGERHRRIDFRLRTAMLSSRTHCNYESGRDVSLTQAASPGTALERSLVKQNQIGTQILQFEVGLQSRVARGTSAKLFREVITKILLNLDSRETKGSRSSG